MGLARSTFYDDPKVQLVEEARLVERMREICAEWPTYGYRRVTAELHGEGHLVNHKKVMRLMNENGLTARPRRRFVATTDSDHDGPIFPNLADKYRADEPQPALGRRHHLHRYRDRLRLSRCDSRRLVTTSRRLCGRQADRCTDAQAEPSAL